MSTLLALDTSTEACSVALLHEGRALSHYEVIPRLHAQRLLPMVRLAGSEAVLPPERVAVPWDAAAADWFGAGTGWGYVERMPQRPAALDASLLPHAEDLLSLAGFAWARGEGVEAEQALPVYLRDNVATPKKAP